MSKTPSYFLLDHLEGCSPLVEPCASCEAVAFLRKALSPQDMDALLALIKKTKLMDQPRKRARRRANAAQETPK